jgi:protein BCP1
MSGNLGRRPPLFVGSTGCWMPKRKRSRVLVEEVDEEPEAVAQPKTSSAAAAADEDPSSSSAEEDTGSDTEVPPATVSEEEAEEEDDDGDEEEQSSDEGDEGEGDYGSDSDSGDDSGEAVDSEEEAAREQADAESIGITEMDIQFFDPTEPDFHAIKVLLQSYLDDSVWAISALVELILAQTRVGSTVRVNDEADGSGSRDPCGFISALNIRQHRKQECIQQICKHALKKCPKKHKARPVFEKALQLDAAPGGSLAQATALLVSERYFNLPAQMAPWLNKALFDEVEWATEDEKTKQERDAYKFKQYVVMTKVQRGPVQGDGDDDGDADGKRAKKQKKQKKRKGAEAERDFKYYKLEDEVFHELAGSNWFTYRLEPTATGQIVERLVMLVPAASIGEVFARCQMLIENPFELAEDGA